jgi:serine/threonine-protein kinase
MMSFKMFKHQGLNIKVCSITSEGIEYQIPACLGDRFEITGLLASGGFGAIFQARDLRIFNRKVLVKASRYEPHLFRFAQDLNREKKIEEQRNRIKHEMKMLRLAQFREIAGTPVLIDLVEAPSPQLFGPHKSADGQMFSLPIDRCLCEPYLVMNLIEGQTLDVACRTKHYQQNILGFTRKLVIQLCGVLNAFHEYGWVNGYELAFIYQDLKPENAIWTPTNNVVLIDFGSFAVRSPDKISQKNLFISTPPYQPPEFSGTLCPQDAIQPTADVYALGVSILHILRGDVPWHPDTDEPDLSLDSIDIPDAWKIWLRKATEYNPKDRFQSMKETQNAAITLPIDAKEQP